jgi:anaerobic magnesium-protoporphyrin IX monomethyl ester cyclase
VKAHITLVNPPQTTGAPNSGFIPLGIGYLAAVLEEDGYAVDVIDCQVEQHTARELESELARIQPDVIGITSTTLTYKSAIDIVQAAKKACPNSLIIMGGPHVTVLDEHTLNEQPEVDIIVRGEGERTLLEIADLVTKSSMKDLNQIAGITFRKNGQIEHR